MTVATGTATPAAPTRAGPRSTTRRLLLRQLTALLVGTAAVLASTLVTVSRVHGAAAAVRTRTAPAIVELAAARVALIRADAAVAQSLQTSELQLTGPGEEFQNQLAIAGQSLTKVAEDNEAGEQGSRRLQLIEGLLVTYQGLIGQADAHFRQPSGRDLGVTDLWSASRLLHGAVGRQGQTLVESGGILTELDQLTDDQRSALDGQVAASSLTASGVLAGLVLLGVLGLLVATQIAFRRRFRRQVNPPLLLATGLLLATAAIPIRGAVAQHHLTEARGTLQQLVADRRQQGSAADAHRLQALRELVDAGGCATAAGCGYTTTLFRSYVDSATAAGAGDIADSRLTEETRQVARLTAAAATGADLEPAIYLLTGIAAASVLLGFRPRLVEYRYRPR
ncbi:MAG TPA: hypothetical protein VMU51_07525 [Mycobacteriales bacterium]|nr:hypothetical protein [Mycobacteriales bacterium]